MKFSTLGMLFVLSSMIFLPFLVDTVQAENITMDKDHSIDGNLFRTFVTTQTNQNPPLQIEYSLEILNLNNYTHITIKYVNITVDIRDGYNITKFDYHDYIGDMYLIENDKFDYKTEINGPQNYYYTIKPSAQIALYNEGIYDYIMLEGPEVTVYVIPEFSELSILLFVLIVIILFINHFKTRCKHKAHIKLNATKCEMSNNYCKKHYE